MPVRLASCGVFLVFRRHFLVFVFSCHLLFLRGRGGWLFSGCTGFVSIKSWWWLGAETCNFGTRPGPGPGLGMRTCLCSVFFFFLIVLSMSRISCFLACFLLYKRIRYSCSHIPSVPLCHQYVYYPFLFVFPLMSRARGQ